MRYNLRKRDGELWVEAKDGVVQFASEGLRWAVGKSIRTLMAYCAAKGYRVYVSERLGAHVKRVELPE